MQHYIKHFIEQTNYNSLNTIKIWKLWNFESRLFFLLLFMYSDQTMFFYKINLFISFWIRWLSIIRPSLRLSFLSLSDQMLNKKIYYLNELVIEISACVIIVALYIVVIFWKQALLATFQKPTSYIILPIYFNCGTFFEINWNFIHLLYIF